MELAGMRWTLRAAVAATAGFDGLVALWPDPWRTLAGNDWSRWREVAGCLAVCLGPAAALLVLRQRASAVAIATAHLAMTIGFVWRFFAIETDPLLDHDLIFTKMDPFRAAYFVIFGMGGWALVLVALPFVLWRHRTSGKDGPHRCANSSPP